MPDLGRDLTPAFHALTSFSVCSKLLQDQSGINGTDEDSVRPGRRLTLPGVTYSTPAVDFTHGIVNDMLLLLNLQHNI